MQAQSEIFSTAQSPTGANTSPSIPSNGMGEELAQSAKCSKASHKTNKVGILEFGPAIDGMADARTTAINRPRRER
jgi:hypothetical protein